MYLDGIHYFNPKCYLSIVRGAFDLNSEVFKNIKEHSNKASKDLAEKFGEPELLKGYGRRNTTLNAVAPTTSSAFILVKYLKV